MHKLELKWINYYKHLIHLALMIIFTIKVTRCSDIRKRNKRHIVNIKIGI